MAVTSHLPAPPLDAYIERLWHCEGPAPYARLRVLPMPTLHLMINFGAACQVHGSRADGGAPWATCGTSWAVGLCDTYHAMKWPRAVRMVSVTFKPGGAAPFLWLPLAELRNQLVSLEALWGGAAEIRERLAGAPTPAARLALLEQLLLARLARLDETPRGRDPGLEVVRYAVAEIARRRGALSIGALSEEIGVSHKHLITQFQQLVGGTPKAVARLYRLQHVLASIDATRPRLWAEVAQHVGYYDEAHFNKDFQVFTGHTPTDYLRVLRQARVEHPEFALSPTFLPTG